MRQVEDQMAKCRANTCSSRRRWRTHHRGTPSQMSTMGKAITKTMGISKLWSYGSYGWKI